MNHLPFSSEWGSAPVPVASTIGLDIRQWAARAPTFITHKHSRQQERKTTETREAYVCAKSEVSLLNTCATAVSTSGLDSYLLHLLSLLLPSQYVFFRRYLVLVLLSVCRIVSGGARPQSDHNYSCPRGTSEVGSLPVLPPGVSLR